LSPRDFDIHVRRRQHHVLDLRGDLLIADRHLPERFEGNPIPHGVGEDRDFLDRRFGRESLKNAFMASRE
jgi:hypothetical protein